MVVNLGSGDNTIRWTVTKDGCSDYDDLIITNGLPDSPILISSDITVCDGQVNLQADEPDATTTGIWTQSGVGGTIHDPTSNNTFAYDLNNGITTFTWTVTNNTYTTYCELSKSFDVTNKEVNANAGIDQNELCVDYARLNAIPTQHTGWWEKGDGQPGIIVQQSSANSDVTELGYGVNKFIWFVQDGICSDSDTVISRNNATSPAMVGYMPATCDTFTTLSASPPTYGTGEWSYIGGYPVVIHSQFSSNTVVSNLARNNGNLFTWTVTNTTPYQTCTEDTSFVVVSNYFTVTAGEDQIICEETTNLQGQTRPLVSNQYWEIITGTPIIDNSTDENTLITLQEGTSTVLRWTVWENGCSDNDIVVISNVEITAVAYDDEVCENYTQLYANPPAPNSGYWTSTNPNIIFTPNSMTANADVTGLTEGANLFTWHVYNAHCSDEATITINYLEPYVAAGPNTPICEGSHKMSANNPAEYNGTGIWTVTQGNGTFVNETYYGTYIIDIPQGENKYTWTVCLRGCCNSETVTITNTKPTISVGVEQNLCQTTTSLTGNEPDEGYYGLWTKVTTGQHIIVEPTLFNTIVTGIESGTAIFEWTVSNANCETSELLTVNNNSVIANAGSDKAICSNAVQLNATLPANATGEWIVIPVGVNIINNTQHGTWVYDLNEGMNLFTWQITKNGCSSSANVTITNDSVIVEAGAEQNICENVATLNATEPAIGDYGLWTKVVPNPGTHTIVSPSEFNSQIIGLSTGTTILQWQVWNSNCSGNDLVYINNNSVTAYAGEDKNTCADSVRLSTSLPANATGLWTGPAGPIILDTSEKITWVRNLNDGNNNIFTWTITKDGCSDTDFVVITNKTLNADAGEEQIICEDYTQLFGNNEIGITGNWTIVSGIGTITNPTYYETTVTGIMKGTSIYQWKVANDVCVDSSIVIVRNKQIDVNAGAGNTILCGTEAEICAIQPQPGQGTGIWTITGGAGIITQPTNYHTWVTNLAPGENILTWTVTTVDCYNSENITINNVLPSQAYTGVDTTICNDYYTIHANQPDYGTGHWEKIPEDAPAIIDNSLSYFTEVSNLTTGVNVFEWIIVNDEGNCQTSDIITITSNQISVFVYGDTEICSDTAYLNGNIPPETYTGTWTVVSGGGIIHTNSNNEIMVTNLDTGVNILRWTITNGTCSNYADITIINNIPTQAYICEDTIYTCASSVELCANNPDINGGEIAYWTLLSGYGEIENPTISNTWVHHLSAQTQLEWSIHKGSCVLSDTVNIINNEIFVQVAMDTSFVCDTIGTLFGNQPTEGESGEWTLLSGYGDIQNPTSYITDVYGLNQGANTFRWSIYDGVCSASINMTIVNEKYDAYANTGSYTVCEPEVIVIGNPPAENAIGTWSCPTGGGVEFDDIHATNTRAYNLQLGNNTIRWTVGVEEHDCYNYDEFVVENTTVTADAGNDIIVCSLDAVKSLNATDPAPNTGTWEHISGNGVTIADNTLYNSDIYNIQLGINQLKWTVSNGTCSASDFIFVNNNYFTISAGEDQEICDTQTVLDATSPGIDGIGLWSISTGGASFENETLFNTNVNGLQFGINTLQWIVSRNGCSDYDEVIIRSYANAANAGIDSLIYESSYQLQAISYPNLEGIWTLQFGSGIFEDIQDPNTIVNDLDFGDNVLRWTTSINGCDDCDEVIISKTIFAGQDTIVEGDTVQLHAVLPEGAIGEWTIMEGTGTFEDPSDPNTIVWGLSPGINVLRWTVTLPKSKLVIWDELTIDRVLSVSDLSSEFLIYPNPSKGTINIISERPIDNVEIYDISGSLVMCEIVEKSSNKLIINFPQGVSGVYFIKININGSIITEKVIMY